MDRFELIAKLAAVEALEAAPGSDGERQAAASARRRLEARLTEASTPRSGCFAQEMFLGHHLRQPEPSIARAGDEVAVPSRTEAARRIDAWRRREASWESVTGWAAAIVDGVVLPTFPADDPASVVPEVLLVLAASPAPDPRLAELVLAFLAAPLTATEAAWRSWLEGLAALD